MAETKYYISQVKIPNDTKVYNLKDFDAGQMLTIRKYIDTNRRKGRVGFL